MTANCDTSSCNTWTRIRNGSGSASISKGNARRSDVMKLLTKIPFIFVSFMATITLFRGGYGVFNNEVLLPFVTSAFTPSSISSFPSHLALLQPLGSSSGRSRSSFSITTSRKRRLHCPLLSHYGTMTNVQSLNLDINENANEATERISRRGLFRDGLVSLTGGSILFLYGMTTTNIPFLDTVAYASGGATAGKYTTIPIAKRRYYGRVQQAVHEFIGLGKNVVIGDMSASDIQTFFDPNGVVVVAAKRKDVNGQCTKKGNDCKGSEIRDSRYNDMKVSMYLLANAFRTDQQKPPDRLPTVKAARAFFSKMDEMEKRVKKRKVGDLESQQLYAVAYEILDAYLDLVELPPIDSGHYEQEFDTLVGETARIT